MAQSRPPLRADRAHPEQAAGAGAGPSGPGRRPRGCCHRHGALTARPSSATLRGLPAPRAAGGAHGPAGKAAAAAEGDEGARQRRRAGAAGLEAVGARGAASPQAVMSPPERGAACLAAPGRFPRPRAPGRPGMVRAKQPPAEEPAGGNQRRGEAAGMKGCPALAGGQPPHLPGVAVTAAPRGTCFATAASALSKRILALCGSLGCFLGDLPEANSPVGDPLLCWELQRGPDNPGREKEAVVPFLRLNSKAEFSQFSLVRSEIALQALLIDCHFYLQIITQ